MSGTKLTNTIIEKNHPQNPFARYADDGVVHCKTEEEACKMRDKIAARLVECKLEIHPGKTRIVYCKDYRRKGKHSSKSFDFLGFTFRPRKAKGDRVSWVLAGNQSKRKKVNQAESAELEYSKTNSRDD